MRSGDIVYRPMNGVPGFRHYGVLIAIGGENDLVAHHDERGPVITTLDDFLGDKTLSGYSPSKLSGQSNDYILDRFERMNSEEFNVLTNNCESWAFKFAKKEYKQMEIFKAGVYALAAIMIYKAIK